MKMDLIQPAPRKYNRPQHAAPSPVLLKIAAESLASLVPGSVLVLTLGDQDESRFAVRAAFIQAEQSQPPGDDRIRLKITTNHSAKDGPWVVKVRSLRKRATVTKKAAE